MTKSEAGIRFNGEKPRFSLAPPLAQLEYVKALHYGAKKYAPFNWAKGLSWMETMDSLERHIHQWKLGQLYDDESGVMHTGHIMANAAFLTEYVHIYPQGDDRPTFLFDAYGNGTKVETIPPEAIKLDLQNILNY